MKYLLLLIAAGILMVSCNRINGSGNLVKEKRSVSEFTGLSVSHGFEVKLRVGSPASLEIEADDNLVQYIETRVEKGVLKIYMDDVNVSDGHLKAFITVPTLNSIRASSAADIELLDEISNNEKITIRSSSGAHIAGTISAPDVETDASSGGTIKISGKTRKYNASASSGAEINTHALLTETSKVSASSGGTVKVHASLNLDASASSGASVSYRGGASVKQSSSSGGSVSKQD